MTTAWDELTKAEQLYGQAQSEAVRVESVAQQSQAALVRAQSSQQTFVQALDLYRREDRLYTVLEAFQNHFFEVNTRRVADRATDLLRYAVTDQTILGIEFRDDDLLFLDGSRTPRPVARLSGGEKALVGLCLRIALAEQAQAITPQGKVRFLILDEVLSSLDEERREAIQRILEDVLRRGAFEHIIMVTPLDAVKHSWRGVTLEVSRVDSKTSQVHMHGQTRAFVSPSHVK